MNATVDDSVISRIERGIYTVLNQLAGVLRFLRKDLDAAAERYAVAAREQHEKGEFHEALASYKKALIRSRKKEYLVDAGEICYALGEYDDAEKFFTLALKLDYFDSRALKGMAYALHAAGNIDHAVYFYFKYLDIQKNDYDALLNLGFGQ